MASAGGRRDAAARAQCARHLHHQLTHRRLARVAPLSQARAEAGETTRPLDGERTGQRRNLAQCCAEVADNHTRARRAGPSMRPRILSYDLPSRSSGPMPSRCTTPRPRLRARSPRSRRSRSSTTRGRGGSTPTSRAPPARAPAVTSPAGTASTCRRPARRSASWAPPRRSTASRSWSPRSDRTSGAGDCARSGRLTHRAPRRDARARKAPSTTRSAGPSARHRIAARPDRSARSGPAHNPTTEGPPWRNCCSCTCLLPLSRRGWRGPGAPRRSRCWLSPRPPPSCGCSPSRPTCVRGACRPSGSHGCLVSASTSTSGSTRSPGSSRCSSPASARSCCSTARGTSMTTTPRCGASRPSSPPSPARCSVSS